MKVVLQVTPKSNVRRTRHNIGNPFVLLVQKCSENPIQLFASWFMLVMYLKGEFHVPRFMTRKPHKMHKQSAQFFSSPKE